MHIKKQKHIARHNLYWPTWPQWNMWHASLEEHTHVHNEYIHELGLAQLISGLELAAHPTTTGDWALNL
jgi:cytochrome c-type biogenesis protein CcmH/NrfG